MSRSSSEHAMDLAAVKYAAQTGGMVDGNTALRVIEDLRSAYDSLYADWSTLYKTSKQRDRE